MANNLPRQIYINEIKNRIVFKIKTYYRLKLLSKETIKLLGSTKQIIDEVKNSEKLELVESVLMHCSVVKK